MIRDENRAGWFGASDTARIMGNWDTLTFRLWWLEKLGIRTNHIRTDAMQAGTAYEHRVLSFIGIARTDRQIRYRILRLRVNLDGEDRGTISEVKTHKGDFKVTKAYWQQCQVEMLATGKKCRIVSYRLTEEEYENFFLPIDQARIGYWPIERDDRFLLYDYLPRLAYLAGCLRRRETPTKEGFSEWSKFSLFRKILSLYFHV